MFKSQPYKKLTSSTCTYYTVQSYEAPAAESYSAPQAVYNVPEQPNYQAQASYGQPTYQVPLQDYSAAPVADEYSAPADTQAVYQPAPGQYQATLNANELAEEVQSGSVYVQPGTSGGNDELYFIYYEDPATGATTAPQVVSNPSELVDPLFYPGSLSEAAAPVAPAPPQSESFRSTGSSGSTGSSASFRISVNGQNHGFENKQ